MKNGNEEKTISKNFDALERIILKMEKLSSLCHVCAAAFDNQKAYSKVCEDDTMNAFYSVADQIEVINQELTTLLWDNKLSDQEKNTEQ